MKQILLNVDSKFLFDVLHFVTKVNNKKSSYIVLNDEMIILKMKTLACKKYSPGFFLGGIPLCPILIINYLFYVSLNLK